MSANSEEWQENTVQIRNKLLVEVLNPHGYTIAFAKRKDVESSWDVAVFSADAPEDLWKHVAVVRSNLPEVLQRKMVLAILGAI